MEAALVTVIVGLSFVAMLGLVAAGSGANGAAANLTTTTLPTANGYVETRTYDRAGGLTEVKNTKGATTLNFSLQPREKATFRFRILVNSGKLTKEQTEALFQQFLKDVPE